VVKEDRRSRKDKSEPRKASGILAVAQEAGVSAATVSRVLNKKPTVDPKICERVQKVIKRLKYRPHYAARNLPRGQTGNIAVATLRGSQVIFSNPFFTRLFEGFGEVLDESPFNLMFCTTPRQMSRLLSAHTVDGICLVSVREDDPFLDEMEEMELPVVVVGAYLRETTFTTFCPDYSGGAIAAVCHLAGLGHTRIGHLNGPLLSYKSQADRLGFEEGIRRAVTSPLNPLSDAERELVRPLSTLERGRPAGEVVQEVGSLTALEYLEQAAYAIFKDHLRMGQELPTAYVASSDFLAIGLLRAALEVGLEVPRDLSVIGFGDIPMASLLHPPLTTLHGDLVEMGADAARALIQMITQERRSPRRVVYPLSIIERSSTGPPPP
jgi:LacI family transcriptional regulator